MDWLFFAWFRFSNTNRGQWSSGWCNRAPKIFLSVALVIILAVLITKLEQSQTVWTTAGHCALMTSTNTKSTTKGGRSQSHCIDTALVSKAIAEKHIPAQSWWRVLRDQCHGCISKLNAARACLSPPVGQVTSGGFVSVDKSDGLLLIKN